MTQFLGEAVFTAFLAVCIAFILTENLLPLFNQVIDKEMKLSYVTQWPFTLEMLGIALFTGLLSGIYPAFIMSSTRLTSLFKTSAFAPGKDKIGIRKVFSNHTVFNRYPPHHINLDFQRTDWLYHDEGSGFSKNNLLYTKLSVTRKDGRMKISATAFESSRNKWFFNVTAYSYDHFGGYIFKLGRFQTGWNSGSKRQLGKLRFY